MANFKKNTFAKIMAAILLVSASLAQGQWSQKPPSNVSETIVYLTTMQNFFPELFVAATKYDQDIFSFINVNRDIYTNLTKDPQYLRLLKKRGNNLLTLTFKNEPDTQNEKKTYSESFQQIWATEAAAVLQEYRGSSDSDFKAWLELNIARNLNSSAYGFSSGMLSGLVQLLPPDQRRIDFIALPVDEILKILSVRLPYNLSETRFDGKVFGLNPHDLTRDHVLSLLREALILERQALLLSQVYISGMSHRDMSAMVGGPWKRVLQQSVSTPFSQRTNQNGCAGFECLQDLFKRYNLKPAFLQALQTQNAKQEKKNLLSSPAKSQIFKNAGLKLVEVPPIASILRGFIGSDCATKCSMPYPNSPMEKVFFILDKEGRSKGYVSGTIVETTKGPALYLHTINGANLSADHVSAIFEALLSHTAELGVKAVVLPNERQLQYLMNSTMIREKFMSYRSDETTRIDYHDAVIRKTYFETLTSSGYDKPENNSEGYFARQIESNRDSVVAEVTNTPRIPLDQSLISRESLVESLISHHLVKGDTSTREQLLTFSERLGLNRKSIDSLLWTLKNPDRLSFEMYMADVSKHLVDLGFKIGPTFLESHWPYFIEGALRSSSTTEASKAILKNWGLQAIKSVNERLIIAILMHSNEPELLLEITALFAKDPDYWKSRPFIKDLGNTIQRSELNAESIKNALNLTKKVEVKQQASMCRHLFVNH